MPKTPVPAPDSVSRRHNEGHGRRLTAAFEALEAFPALAESRNRVLRVVREDRSSVGEVVAAVESDVALVITVLRIANRAAGRKKGKLASIPEAVELLTPEGVEALVSRTATFDFFERTRGGSRHRSASGSMPWPPRRPRTGWRARSAMTGATSCSARRSSTTSASSS